MIPSNQFLACCVDAIFLLISHTNSNVAFLWEAFYLGSDHKFGILVPFSLKYRTICLPD